MPWTYRQRSGELLFDGHKVSVGYSGRGENQNNPASQCIVGEGPIPRGWYTVGRPFNDLHMGPFVLGLEPHPSNSMFCRSQFYCHGDNASAPGTASRGCIILDRASRTALFRSGDFRLEVVE